MRAVLKISVVVGNPKPNSRTARVATAVATSLATPGVDTITVVDLAEHASKLFDWPSEELAALSKEVAESDVIVVASPTYKATYTGLLKAFLDRYPNQGLKGVIAVPVMTGADLRHSMGPDVNLRPLLVELGACVPSQSLYFVMDQVDQLDAIVARWAEDARPRMIAQFS